MQLKQKLSDYWEKAKYDEKNRETYFEDSRGNWLKRGYDAKGTVIYWEDSEGHLEDNRNQVNESLVNVNRLDTPEKWFRNLLKSLHTEVDEDYNYAFFYKDDNQEVYMNYYTIRGHICVNRALIYDVLNTRFNLDDNKIALLIREIMGEMVEHNGINTLDMGVNEVTLNLCDG